VVLQGRDHALEDMPFLVKKMTSEQIKEGRRRLKEFLRKVVDEV